MRDSVEAALERDRAVGRDQRRGIRPRGRRRTDAGRCERENVVGPRVLAGACRVRRLPLLTFSSDLVFDGKKPAPYVESDPSQSAERLRPSKVRAEAAVLAADPRALVVRTSAFFGPADDYNFVAAVLRELSALRVFRAASDLSSRPRTFPTSSTPASIC